MGFFCEKINKEEINEIFGQIIFWGPNYDFEP